MTPDKSKGLEAAEAAAAAMVREIEGTVVEANAATGEYTATSPNGDVTFGVANVNAMEPRDMGDEELVRHWAELHETNGYGPCDTEAALAEILRRMSASGGTSVAPTFYETGGEE